MTGILTEILNSGRKMSMLTAQASSGGSVETADTPGEHPYFQGPELAANALSAEKIIFFID